VSAQVGFVLVGGAAWGNKAAGSLRPFATQGAAPRPGRRLPARAPLVHRGGYPDHEYPECPEYGEKTQENERRGHVMLGIGSGAGRIEVLHGGTGGERDDQANARPSGRLG
jgi:hypothetical protein